MKCGRTACNDEAEGYINTDGSFRNYCFGCAVLINKANPDSYQVTIPKLEHWNAKTPREQAELVQAELVEELEYIECQMKYGEDTPSSFNRVQLLQKEKKLLWAFVRGYAKWD